MHYITYNYYILFKFCLRFYFNIKGDFLTAIGKFKKNTKFKEIHEIII